MPDLGLVILYVDNPPANTAFYAALLGRQPVEASLTFAVFALPTGIALGLWSRHTVQPAAVATAGSTEIAFTSPDVDAVHADWAARGLTIAQSPTDLDFGRTFVALDPDGHRLRVLTPASNETP